MKVNLAVQQFYHLHLDHGCTESQVKDIFGSMPRIQEDSSLLSRVLAQKMEKYDNSTLLGEAILQFFFESPLPKLYEVFTHYFFSKVIFPAICCKP